MQNIRKRLLSVCLAAVISVSAASVPAWSDNEEEAAAADAQTGEGASEEAPAEEDNGIYVTEDEAFAAMKQ